jgi:L-idonate 5-dehydrogenase
MKAIVIHRKLELVETELPTPTPRAGEVRLRMAYGGICGSDLHYYNDGAVGAFVIREPLIPGHELSGTVDLDPSGDLAPGTPVTIHPATFGTSEPGIEHRPHLWPNGAYLGSASTWPHTQGGMSEFVVVGKHMIRTLPATLPLRRATLAEPLGVALHALRIAGDVKGRRVLVSGSGPIGLLTAAAALAEGAAEVVSADLFRVRSGEPEDSESTAPSRSASTRSRRRASTWCSSAPAYPRRSVPRSRPPAGPASSYWSASRRTSRAV